MSTKRKPTLKQLFNAWLKAQKKETEAYAVRCAVNKLAREIDNYATELIEYEEKIYRVTINRGTIGSGYNIEIVAKTAELPVKN